jgi:hypothetical protein
MYILATKRKGIVWFAAGQGRKGRQQALAVLVYKSPHFLQAAVRR